MIQLRRTLRWRVLLIAVCMFLLLAGTAAAHPLGNFTINHYARLELAPDGMQVRFVLDYAEIPTFQEKQAMDLDGDAKVGDSERASYLRTQLPRLIENLQLTVNGRPVPLGIKPERAELEFLPGQAGLQVMRLSAWLDARAQLDTNGTSVTFRDENYSARLGWREIVVVGSSGLGIDSLSGAGADVSHELTTYPQDLLNNPRNDREASFKVRVGAVGSSSASRANSITNGALGAFDRTRDEFGKLINTTQELSPIVLLVSFLAAIALGALHAFSPGHGKAVVGAYLVGSRGTWQHALFLGLIVTATHTAGVYALGLVTLFLSAYVLPEQLFPWLGFLSGALVAVIGARLAVERLRAARNHSTSYDRALSHLDHSHEFASAQSLQPALAAAHTDSGSAPTSRSSHPYVTAGASEHHHASNHIHTHHHHDHGHSHAEHGEHAHSHDFATPEEEAAHAREHLAEIEMLEKPTWKNLLTLGISGGLLPCPSALVVMLSAIGLGRVLYGLYLIVGFSLGLAGVLVVTGLALLYAGKLAGRYLRGARAGVFFRYVPLFGACVVALLGVGIALDALYQAGIIR